MVRILDLIIPDLIIVLLDLSIISINSIEDGDIAKNLC